MKRLICITVCAVLASAVMQAIPRSRTAALQLAAAFLAERHAAARSAEPTPEPTLTEATSPFGGLYVFNVGSDEGFVIVGGDDRLEAVLGYAESGRFDAATMPENMRAWLDGVDGVDGVDGQDGLDGQSAQVAHQAAPAAQPLDPIRPLIRTAWAQREPYNNLCPDGSPTGCVATALAQVMKYHEWPQDSTAAIPAYNNESELPAAVLDWANMLNGYGGNEPQEAVDAVAQLMLYCGHAVKMVYDTSSSAASDQLIPYSLCNYFGYDAGIRQVLRSQYTSDEWEALIYGELQAARPVIISGRRMTSGHDFICDGYDGDGFFHINWGWGGSYDGFYRLSLLNPYTTGSMLANRDGYTLNQSAIVGIQPDRGSEAPTADTDELLLTAERLTLTGDANAKRTGTGKAFTVNICSPLVNLWPVAAKFRYGLGLMQDGKLVGASTHQAGIAQVLPAASVGRSASQSFTFGKGLTGTYRIVPICTVYSRTTLRWQPALGSDKFYIEAVITDKAVTLTEYPRLDIVVNKVTTTHEADRLAFDVAITNRGEDYDGPLTLVVNGTVVSSIGIIIASGASDVVQFHYSPGSDGTKQYHIGYHGTDKSWIASGKVDFYAEDLNSFAVWDAQGQLRRLALDDDGRAVVPPDAVAVDMGSLRQATVVANDNPNCLYYVAAATDEEPALEVDALNVVVGTFADAITLTDGYDFYCPKSFTAGSAVYTRTFTRGYDGAGGGWDTIMLPFDVQTVTPEGRGPIDWFRSADDADKDFWLMTIADSGWRRLRFEHARQMEANRPYLIAVPGDAYGDRSLTGTDVTFAAEHAVVHRTAMTSDGGGEYSFSGTFATELQPEWYQLNGMGAAFKRFKQAVAPFRATVLRGSTR